MTLKNRKPRLAGQGFQSLRSALPLPVALFQLIDAIWLLALTGCRFAMVLWATQSAPEFLRARKGRAALWEGPESVFPLLGHGHEIARDRRPGGPRPR